MKLMFAINRLDDTGDVTRVTCDSDSITCGSAETADISLRGLPKLAFRIKKINDSDMILERDSQDVALIIDGETAEGASIAVRNGSEIDVGPYRILISVTFERANCSSRSGLAVMVSSFLVIAIIVAEIAVVNWLPRRIQKSALWGAEVLRQETLHSLDKLRYHIRHSNGKRKEDPLFQPTLTLYKRETDRMALYLRENQSRMTTEQLKQFKCDVLIIENQVHLLTQGTLIPPERKLNSTRTVEMIINQKDMK